MPTPIGLGQRTPPTPQVALFEQMVQFKKIPARSALAPYIAFRHQVVGSSLRNLVLAPRDR